MRLGRKSKLGRLRSELILRFVLALLLGSYFLFPQEALSQVPDPQLHFNTLETADPSIHFNTIETLHFRIVFDSRHLLIAELYADYAEEAYLTMFEKFNKEAPDKTLVYIDDISDQANGSAVGIPYPIITAFGALPSPSEPVADYGNWGRELLMHEFTHILNFEPAHGVFTPLRYIFGNLIRPNMFLPRWYLEGLAVEEETEFSNFGRLRSANFTSQLRALSLEGLLEKENISRINEVGIPYWPFGSRPYLMGSILWDEIIRGKDPAIIGRLNDRYSRRFPFFLSGPIADEMKKDFQALLDDAYRRIASGSLAQKEKIQSASEFQSKKFISQLGFDTNSPALSPDRMRLLLVTHSEDSESLIELRQRRIANVSFSEIPPKKLLESTGTLRVAWLGNSNEFVYDAIDVNSHYAHFSDLYKYDIAREKGDRLTRGLRAREPSVSLDGQDICFVQLDTGYTRLAKIHRDGSGFEILYSPEIQFRISRPEFLSLNEIVFSERNTTGKEVLKIFDLRTRLVKDLLPDYSPMHFSKLTREGLIFESEKSGVANIYLASEDLRTAKPITNVVTGASSAEIDSGRDELLVTILSGTGQNVEAVNPEVWQNQPAQLPLVEPLIGNHWKKHVPPLIHADKKLEDYSPWPYLYPRYWVPYLYFLPGGSYFSASTTASDPVGHHIYSLVASYDTLSKKPSIFGSYSNNTISTPVTLNVYDYNEYIYALNETRQSFFANPFVTSFVPGLSKNYSTGLGWNYFQTSYPGQNLTANGPGIFLSYANVSKRGFQISPEKGGTAYVAYNSYLPNISNVTYDEFRFSGSYFLSGFLPKHHALAGLINLYYAPKLDHLLLGRTTSSAVYQQNVLDSSFILRGYPYGALIGRSLFSGNLEYRFPIRNSYDGYDVKPLFFQKYYGSVFVDAASVDGAYYSKNLTTYNPVSPGHYFVGSGLELKADTTLFYQVPVTFTLGLYYGFDNDASYGFTPFLGFLL